MTIDSVYPCTEYLTFGPWIYLVPQIEPQSVLMLGYAQGTVAGLMRRLYGYGFPITAVDKADPEHADEYHVDFVRADAEQYVEVAAWHEVLIVDLWVYDPPPFVFTAWFVSAVTARCDYLIVHRMDYSDMSAYRHLHKVRTLGLDYGARFDYFMVNRVARLPVR